MRTVSTHGSQKRFETYDKERKKRFDKRIRQYADDRSSVGMLIWNTRTPKNGQESNEQGPKSPEAAGMEVRTSK